MLRNEFLSRSLMVLCFSTAILFLAIEWQSLTFKSASKVTSPVVVKPVATKSVSQLTNSSPTQLVVKLSDHQVYVYRDNQIVANYPLAVGKKGWETPTGTWKVVEMQPHPIWRHPITGAIFNAGPKNPLGERWIGFWSDGNNQIGFHGTEDTDLLGTAVSHGCLRMRNSDIKAMYDQVSLGTPVIVQQ